MSDVNVEVSGLPFNQKAISGISITYGYNQVPVAAIQLVPSYIEENNASFLCNPDQFKKSTRDAPVTINLKAKTGCIKFTGVFDGMSSLQTPGGFSYSAIIKSQFQCMHELYPKFVGLDPVSILPFKRVPALKIQIGSDDTPYNGFRSPLERVDPSKFTLVEYYIELIKALVKCQDQAKLVSNTTQELAPILKLMQDDRYKANITKCLKFLNEIDLTYVKKTEVKAGQCLNYLVDRVIYAKDTLWDTLVSGLDEMGCMLLPANDKIYVVPKAVFLKMSGNSAPGFRQQATKPNEAYPADFSQFSINDVSYRNLRACFVVPMIHDTNQIMHSFRSQALGSFIDTKKDDGATGILVVDAPQFIIQNIDGLYVKNDKTQNKLKGGSEGYGGVRVIDSFEQPQADYKAAIKAFEEAIKPLQTVLDNYAKSRYLQEKYGERGGCFDMVLKPSWVPGTTGFLYSRHPGLYYNFFVTSVTHTVSLGNGKVGSANTGVSFCACRYAGSPGDIDGVDQADLYKFQASDMSALQSAWLGNVNGTAVPNKDS